VSEARRALDERGFAVVRGLVNPVQASLYRRYFRVLEEEGWLSPDPQVADARRITRHREPVCEFLHAQVASFVQAVVPDAMPSYSLLGVYHPGAVLRRHLDRPQCEWNMSLVLDADPDVPLAEAWPLFIEAGGEAFPVRLAVGDAVLYSGTKSWHWREALPEGRKTAAAFFHFVPRGFRAPLD
jgi:hypothetical protein